MSLNSRIIKALEPMKLKVTVSEYPVNDEELKRQMYRKRMHRNRVTGI